MDQFGSLQRRWTLRVGDVCLSLFGHALDMSAATRIENEEAARIAYARDADFIPHRVAAPTDWLYWLHPFQFNLDSPKRLLRLRIVTADAPWLRSVPTHLSAFVAGHKSFVRCASCRRLEHCPRRNSSRRYHPVAPIGSKIVPHACYS